MVYSATKETEGERLDRLRADQIDHNLKIDRGLYAPYELLEHAFADAAGQIRSILGAVPKRIKNSMPSLRARELGILKRELTKAQNAMSEIQLRK